MGQPREPSDNPTDLTVVAAVLIILQMMKYIHRRHMHTYTDAYVITVVSWVSARGCLRLRYSV